MTKSTAMIFHVPRSVVIALAGLGIAWPLSCHAQQTVTLLNTPTNSSPNTSIESKYREAIKLRYDGDWEGAMAIITQALQQDPVNVRALILRGDLYAKKRFWNQANQDFSAALKIDPQNALARFNLAEIKLMQKQYADARPGFLALVVDEQLGDLAAYKVFLCDLYGGNQADEAKELQDFNQVADKPSFYYSNAAWMLYNGKADEARELLQSAARIYSPEKNYNYMSTLKELGYLPLPAK